MPQTERKKKVLKSVIAQIFYTIILVVLGFVSRKIFVVYLSKELLGLNGLLTSIIGMLSLAELGVGEAINYSLYKPLAEEDNESVKTIMDLYKKCYIAIGIAIVILGIVIMPVLPYLCKTSIKMAYVYKVYVLFLLDAGLSYCLAYSRNIISADQKDYIVTNVDSVSQIIITLFQVIVLIHTHSYIIYLAVKIGIVFVRNFYLHKKSLKLFPYLKEKNITPIGTAEKKSLIENVKALFVIKVATYCVQGTDNMLLSAFCSLGAVAIYGNYTMIFYYLNQVSSVIFTKARASVGNYLQTEDVEKGYILFKNFFFINFIIVSLVSTGVFGVSDKILILWLGEDFVWPLGLIGIIAFNNYSRNILQACEVFRGAAGLYSPRKFVKYLALFEGALNLVASVFCIKILNMGEYGVFVGTFISTLVSTIAVPWIVYRFLFKKSLKEYYAIYFKYMITGLLVLFLSRFIVEQIYLESLIITIAIGIIVCVSVTVVVYTILFGRSEEFQYLVDLIKKIMKRKNA